MNLDVSEQNLETIRVDAPQPYKSLNISRNPIADLGFLQFFTALKTLNMAECGLEDVSELSPSVMQNLRSLDLSGNAIASYGKFPQNMPNLTNMQIDRNPLWDSDEIDLRMVAPRLRALSFEGTGANVLVLFQKLMENAAPGRVFAPGPLILAGDQAVDALLSRHDEDHFLLKLWSENLEPQDAFDLSVWALDDGSISRVDSAPFTVAQLRAGQQLFKIQRTQTEFQFAAVVVKTASQLLCRIFSCESMEAVSYSSTARQIQDSLAISQAALAASQITAQEALGIVQLADERPALRHVAVGEPIILRSLHADAELRCYESVLTHTQIKVHFKALLEQHGVQISLSDAEFLIGEALDCPTLQNWQDTPNLYAELKITAAAQVFSYCIDLDLLSSSQAGIYEPRSPDKLIFASTPHGLIAARHPTKFAGQIAKAVLVSDSSKFTAVLYDSQFSSVQSDEVVEYTFFQNGIQVQIGTEPFLVKEFLQNKQGVFFCQIAYVRAGVVRKTNTAAWGQTDYVVNIETQPVFLNQQKLLQNKKQRESIVRLSQQFQATLPNDITAKVGQGAKKGSLNQQQLQTIAAGFSERQRNAEQQAALGMSHQEIGKRLAKTQAELAREERFYQGEMNRAVVPGEAPAGASRSPLQQNFSQFSQLKQLSQKIKASVTASVEGSSKNKLRPQVRAAVSQVLEYSNVISKSYRLRVKRLVPLEPAFLVFNQKNTAGSPAFMISQAGIDVQKNDNFFDVTVRFSDYDAGKLVWLFVGFGERIHELIPLTYGPVQNAYPAQSIYRKTCVLIDCAVNKTFEADFAIDQQAFSLSTSQLNIQGSVEAAEAIPMCLSSLNPLHVVAQYLNTKENLTALSAEMWRVHSIVKTNFTDVLSGRPGEVFSPSFAKKMRLASNTPDQFAVFSFKNFGYMLQFQSVAEKLEFCWFVQQFHGELFDNSFQSETLRKQVLTQHDFNGYPVVSAGEYLDQLVEMHGDFEQDINQFKFCLVGTNIQPLTYLVIVGKDAMVHRIQNVSSGQFEFNEADIGLGACIINGFQKVNVPGAFVGANYVNEHITNLVRTRFEREVTVFDGVNQFETTLSMMQDKFQLARTRLGGRASGISGLVYTPQCVLLSLGRARVLIQGPNVNEIQFWALTHSGRNLFQ